MTTPTRKPRADAARDIGDAEEAAIQRMIAADPDDEEVSDEAAKHRMTFAEAHPEIAAAIDRSRKGPRKPRA